MESLEHFRCFRLAARIDELRRDGHVIRTQMIRQGRKDIAQYVMEQST